MRRLRVDDHLDLRGRDVADAPVERQVHLCHFAGVVDEAVLTRMAGPFEPATNHPFVEALEPAEPAAILQVDLARMDNLLDR